MKSSAFSLVEVLVVMAVVAVLALISVPAFEQMLKGSRVTIAGRSVLDELSLARQTALSRSLPVEVRFYELSNEVTPSAAPVYRAMQCFVGDENLTPLGKTIFFPTGVMILKDGESAAMTKSSIFLKPGPLSNPDAVDGANGIPVPGYTSYKFISFRFRSNGETDFNSNSVRPFFTLVSQADLHGGTALPPNFFTIQIDPANGRSRSFRP